MCYRASILCGCNHEQLLPVSRCYVPWCRNTTVVLYRQLEVCNVCQYITQQARRIYQAQRAYEEAYQIRQAHLVVERDNFHRNLESQLQVPAGTTTEVRDGVVHYIFPGSQMPTEPHRGYNTYFGFDAGGGPPRHAYRGAESDRNESASQQQYAFYAPSSGATGGQGYNPEHVFDKGAAPPERESRSSGLNATYYAASPPQETQSSGENASYYTDAPPQEARQSNEITFEYVHPVMESGSNDGSVRNVILPEDIQQETGIHTHEDVIRTGLYGQDSPYRMPTASERVSHDLQTQNPDRLPYHPVPEGARTEIRNGVEYYLSLKDLVNHNNEAGSPKQDHGYDSGSAPPGMEWQSSGSDSSEEHIDAGCTPTNCVFMAERQQSEAAEQRHNSDLQGNEESNNKAPRNGPVSEACSSCAGFDDGVSPYDHQNGTGPSSTESQKSEETKQTHDKSTQTDETSNSSTHTEPATSEHNSDSSKDNTTTALPAMAEPTFTFYDNKSTTPEETTSATTKPAPSSPSHTNTAFIAIAGPTFIFYDNKSITPENANSATTEPATTSQEDNNNTEREIPNSATPTPTSQEDSNAKSIDDESATDDAAQLKEIEAGSEAASDKDKDDDSNVAATEPQDLVEFEKEPISMPDMPGSPPLLDD